MSEWTLKEHSKGELVVVVEGSDWKSVCEKAFNKIAKQVAIPGFRKGFAPKAMLKKYITGEQIWYDAIEKHANKWMFDAMKEKNLEPVSRPTLDVRSVNDDSCELVFEFYVTPEVKLGQYKDLPYELGDTTVTDEEIENELNRMRETYADIESTEEPAVDGDTVNIDYEGFKDGVPFEGGKAEGYDLRLGSNSFIPGFEEQLIGAKAGEEKELNLKFPEDYHSEELAGADVVFKVKVNEVKHKVLPELDDDFAKDINAPGVETVEQLRKTVTERLENNKKSAAEREADEKLLAKVAENAEVEIPQPMIDDEAEQMVRQFETQIRQYGMDPKQYYKMLNTDPDKIAENYKEDAEKAVRLRLVLEQIAREEEIEVSDAELEQEFHDLADMYRLDAEQVRNAIDEGIVKKDIANRKAVEFVKEHAAKA